MEGRSQGGGGGNDRRRAVRRSLCGAALGSVLLIGLGGGVVASAVTTLRAGTGPGGCFDPASYPIPPTGRQDDSPRIQAAIDDAVAAVGVIDAENVADGVKIDGNVIRRHGAAGPAIKVTPHSGGIPNQVSISNNTIVTDGNADAVYTESVRNLGVRDNDVTFTGPAPDGSGIHLDAISGPIDQAMITGNTIAGPLTATGGNTYYAAVRLAARPGTISGVTVALNSAHGAIRSLDCAVTGGSFPEPIISLGNRWTVTPTCPAATLQPGQ